MTAVVGIMCCAVPLFFLLQEATLFKAACVRIILTVFGVCLAAPYHAWAFEEVAAEHRYLVGAFGTALGGKLFGSSLPLLSLWLYDQTGLISAPAWPLVILGILPMFYLMKSRARQERAVSAA